MDPEPPNLHSLRIILLSPEASTNGLSTPLMPFPPGPENLSVWDLRLSQLVMSPIS